MDALSACSQLPGFGFHPSDEELVTYYLKRKILGLKFESDVIPEVEIYKHEPWDLPAICHVPTQHSKWHFFSLPDRKYANSSRSNRATLAGYWKTTGRDRSIKSRKHIVGTKKTLVFHEGRPPHGKRTDWIMHEYFIDENEIKSAAHVKDIYLLCRITKRDGFASPGELAPTVRQAITILQQPEVTTHSAISNEAQSSPENLDDVDLWIAELFVPDANPDHACDQEQKTEAATSLPVPEQEQVCSVIDQDAVDDKEFLLKEDLYSILPPEADNFDPDAFGIPNTELKAVLFTSSNSDPLLNGIFHNMDKVVNEENMQYMATTSAFTALIRSTEPANSGFPIENSDTGIQVRQHHSMPSTSQATSRIRLEVSKMKSNSSTSVNHTCNLVKHHLNPDEAEERVCTSSLALEKLSFSSDSLKSNRQSNPISNIQIPDAEKTPQRASLSVRSAAQNWLLIGACIAGTVALLVYFLQHEAVNLFTDFSSVGV